MRRRREMEAAAPRDGLPHNRGGTDDLYTELWRACAGSSVYVPRVGERVFYFPQGHLEQVAAFTQHQQDGHMEIPVYDLPPKILCRVVCVLLKAETYTDEVFAQVTLVPEPRQNHFGLENEDNNVPSRTTTYSFGKVLTPSDTSTHGGFSIPKRHADECFRPLDMTLQTPAQEIVAKDLHGFEWHFRHIYRGQPKRHLLTSGWSTFVNAKKLVAGDSCIFVSGEDGQVRVGIRRAIRHHGNASPSSSLISGHSMQLGILASASHAVATGSMFTVYYHPWTNPFEFIIPLQNYLKSTVPDYSIGTRVQMQCDVEESLRRYAGTIIGNEVIDSIRWPGSEWRCLKVQWDAIVDAFMHPERVCPWWIEPLESGMEKHIPVLPNPKKAHVLHQRPLPGLNVFAMDDAAAQSSARRVADRGLQGQDYSGLSTSRALQRPPSTDVIHPSKFSIGGSQFGKENLNQLPFLMQDILHKSLGRSRSLPHEDLSISSSNLSSICSESLGWPPSESRNENDAPLGHLGSCSKYKLFGVNLIDRQPELPSPQFAGFSKTSSLLSSPPMCVTSGKTCKKCRSVNNRSCTKVLKLGTALGRAVDLTRFRGYDELIAELDSMFDFGGSLVNGSSGWHVTCIDDDGDMMFLRDYPWQDFQCMVQKMIICQKDGINNLNPSSSTDPPSL
ncbi:auxin response factor 2A [Vigna radiata var. radiata]|uniref:Auxin response factor n=1 Tax=Vigna radiata var. radiata TaxID=3916 RepID=A0A3Q0EX70_VIGRR|nr:auxin response factor 2A [Vigna radiata var. radiata]XP_022635039.1 auxin response factor 2A [Vigna radiata var. radiata]